VEAATEYHRGIRHAIAELLLPEAERGVRCSCAEPTPGLPRMLILDDISAVTAIAHVRRSAGIECCLALWAARAPEQEPLLKVTRRVEAAMAPAERDVLRSLDETFAYWPLYAVNAFYGLEVDTLEESLLLLRQQPSRSIAVAFLGVFPESAAKPHDRHVDVLATVLREGRVPDATLRSARALIAQPEETVSRVLRVIGAFARAGFREIFEKQREPFAPVAASLAKRLARDAARTMTELSPRAVLRPEDDCLTFLGGPEDQVVACGQLNHFDVMPTYWLRRRVILVEASGRAGLCVSVGSALRGEMDQQRTVMMLTALSDPRRFEIFRLCLQRSRTTTELAAMLKITSPPVSRHLKELERAGLVVRQRRGRFVAYTAVIEVLQLLGRELLGLPQRVTDMHFTDK
jgi:DNA-binding transcriptional ArsR family regulator